MSLRDLSRSMDGDVALLAALECTDFAELDQRKILRAE